MLNISRIFFLIEVQSKQFFHYPQKSAGLHRHAHAADLLITATAEIYTELPV